MGKLTKTFVASLVLAVGLAFALPAVSAEPTKEDLQRWNQEFMSVVKEGEKLFHSGKLGKNNVSGGGGLRKEERAGNRAQIVERKAHLPRSAGRALNRGRRSRRAGRWGYEVSRGGRERQGASLATGTRMGQWQRGQPAGSMPSRARSAPRSAGEGGSAGVGESPQCLPMSSTNVFNVFPSANGRP